jgi:tRNA-(ms[2]io[6]A)-hydroxylase
MQVLAVIEARGLRFERQIPSSYVARLCAAIHKTDPERLVDNLLYCALIEARSCERMQLLASAEDPIHLHS